MVAPEGIPHEQVEVTHPLFPDIKVEVDKLLVPVLIPVWRMGVVTRYSCQGQKWDYTDANYNRGYIAYDAGDYELMRVAMGSMFPHYQLFWQDFDNYEKVFKKPRSTGPMWSVRFPAIKEESCLL